MDIEKMLVNTMEYEVIRGLMAGNDSQCFSLDQYHAARDDWIAKVSGWDSREVMRADMGLDDAHLKQLRAFPTVVEVKELVDEA